MRRLGCYGPHAAGALLVVLVSACSGGPSKGHALEAIQSGVKEDGSCTLPLDILSQIKVQHVTKAVCVPKEGAAKARACIDALVAAGITQAMPESYMLTWPDEVATASLSDIPAYERRARKLTYGTCVALVGDLRGGRFACADVQASKVLKVTASDATHADVRYERDIKLRPTLPAIDAACGTVSRPPGDAQVAFTKNDSGWVLSPAPAATGPGAGAATGPGGGAN